MQDAALCRIRWLTSAGPASAVTAVTGPRRAHSSEITRGAMRHRARDAVDRGQERGDVGVRGGVMLRRQRGRGLRVPAPDPASSMPSVEASAGACAMRAQ